MFAQNMPKLKVFFENRAINIEDALNKQPELVLEALTDAFLLLLVGEDTLTRIRLGECFRRSLQASRQTTPYRLHTIIAGCYSGTKVVEKVAAEAISSHCEAAGVLHPGQMGSRRQHNTINTIAYPIQEIRQAWGQNSW
ncbi:hypothetical protein BBP40_007259 [Aspergillus hancockii]|nr:hypothetical protein BBP40_007259 [Aspergillus hancockii]